MVKSTCRLVWFLLSWAQVLRAPQKQRQCFSPAVIWMQSSAGVNQVQKLCCSEGAMGGCAAELDPWLWASSALTSAFPQPLSWCCHSFLNCSFLICVNHYSAKRSFRLGSESADLVLSWEFVPCVSVPWVLNAASYLGRSFFVLFLHMLLCQSRSLLAVAWDLAAISLCYIVLRSNIHVAEMLIANE